MCGLACKNLLESCRSFWNCIYIYIYVKPWTPPPKVFLSITSLPGGVELGVPLFPRHSMYEISSYMVPQNHPGRFSASMAVPNRSCLGSQSTDPSKTSLELARAPVPTLRPKTDGSGGQWIHPAPVRWIIPVIVQLKVEYDVELLEVLLKAPSDTPSVILQLNHT